jgi:hypothetical protein
MTGSPNLAKNRKSGYLAPNAVFTENRWEKIPRLSKTLDLDYNTK